MDSLKTISTRRTLQSEPSDPQQKQNNAGGYTFTVNDDARLLRFLTLGVDTGTYYVTEKALTRGNADFVINLARTRGEWLVEQTVAVSVAGRAPKVNPAIFALAVAAGVGDDASRRAALAAVPLVCRTGTHLFLFAEYVQQFRGWGRGLRNAIGAWYLRDDVDQLAYQVVKYRSREGWTHRDLLRQAHPVTADPGTRALFEWILRGVVTDEVPDLIRAFETAQKADTVKEWVSLIEASTLSWEMLPDAALTEPKVWQALLTNGRVPMTALIRQLPRLTRLGVLAGKCLTLVTDQLTSVDRLVRARVHPMNILVAQRTYTGGQSLRGSSEWTPIARVSDALDAAFYASYGAVVPSGKRTLLALDVSGSMGSSAGGLPVSCREASVAIAMVSAATETVPVDVVGFTAVGGRTWSYGTELTELDVSPRRRLDDNVRTVADLPFGQTDCSLPMVWAAQQGRLYDTFVVYTDNETYAGHQHPHQALREYRNQTGIPARLVVVGMTSTEFTIADPSDPGMLDVAGFDTGVPQMVSDFSAGRV